MIIGLDYDGTYTADKLFWSHFIDILQHWGHDFYIVTMRSKEHDWHDDFAPYWPDKVIFCDGRAKKNVVDQLGIEIDIWIDDNPITIQSGSLFTPEMLAEWRAQNKINGT